MHLWKPRRQDSGLQANAVIGPELKPASTSCPLFFQRLLCEFHAQRTTSMKAESKNRLGRVR
jgi:hypothetical protein